MTIEALLYEQGKISKEEVDAICEINGKHCLRLFRGTSKKTTEWNICGDYLDHHAGVMDTTIDRKIAEGFAERTPDPIILEIYVPVNEINFEGHVQEKVHAKIFTRGFCLEKDYSAYLQVPLKWIKNYYDVKTNKIIENSNFDPTFVPVKRFNRGSVIDEHARYLMSKYAIKLPKSDYTIELSESKYVTILPKSNHAQKKLKGLKTYFKG